jgi:hypothetical protein
MPTCGNIVFGRNTECAKCGSTKTESEEGAAGTYPPGYWVCDCRATNPAHRRRCQRKTCGWCPRCGARCFATCDKVACDGSCKVCNSCTNGGCVATKRVQDARVRLEEIKATKNEKVQEAVRLNKVKREEKQKQEGGSGKWRRVLKPGIVGATKYKMGKGWFWAFEQ